MNIGLFFGSFNPIHNGHLMVANFCLEEYGLDKILLVVAAHNPFKNSTDLIPFDQRVEMATIAVEENDKMEVETIESTLSEPFYTFNTLEALKIKYPNSEFALIIGLDNWLFFDKWYKSEELLSERIIVLPRGNYGDIQKFINKKNKLQDMFFNKRLDIFSKSRFATRCPNCTMSSSFIRNELKENRSVFGYTPQTIVNYIIKNKLYGL